MPEVSRRRQWHRGSRPDLSTLAPGSVAVVFGTRPEIVKLAGIIQLLGDRARLIFSGQHFDDNMYGLFFNELGIPPPCDQLDVGGRSRGEQIGLVLQALDELLNRLGTSIVVVQGDTNSTLGGALAANAREIPLVHVEAGLRSFDRRMPEEHNRVVTDHLADLCCAPTEVTRRNLMSEGIESDRIRVTGNTVVDAVLRILPPRRERAKVLQRWMVTPNEFILATFHRPENVDDGERLQELVRTISQLNMPVILPVHPRTRQHLQHLGVLGEKGSLRLVEPVGYPTFLSLMAECALTVSDSGGVQEEASVLKKPVVVVRRSTERPEVLGTFAILTSSLADMRAQVETWLSDLEKVHDQLSNLPSPYGEGWASQVSVEAILSLVRK